MHEASTDEPTQSATIPDPTRAMLPKLLFLVSVVVVTIAFAQQTPSNTQFHMTDSPKRSNKDTTWPAEKQFEINRTMLNNISFHQLLASWQAIFCNFVLISYLIDNANPLELTAEDLELMQNEKTLNMKSLGLSVEEITSEGWLKVINDYNAVTYESGLLQNFSNTVVDIKKEDVYSLETSVVKLRRQIMITNLHIKHKVNHSICQDVDTCMIYNETLYTELMSIFALIYNNYSIMSPRKAFFNLHVHKSMGSSICATAKQLGLRVTRAHNCNYKAIPQQQAPVTCQYYQSFLAQRKLNFVARENFITSAIDQEHMQSQTTSEVPFLCSQFHYILVFRNPIERSISDVRFDCQFERARCPFYAKTEDVNTSVPDSVSKKGTIRLNGSYYETLRSVKDFQHFVQIFDQEPFSVYDEYVSHLRASGEKLSVLWFGKNHTMGNYLFKQNDNNELELKQTVRDWRAKVSNYYTRFLGYNYSLALKSNQVHQKLRGPKAAMAPTYEINYNMFSNAANLMMNISYVVPMTTDHSSSGASKSSHPNMFKILFEVLKGYGQNSRSSMMHTTRTSPLNWVHTNEAKGSYNTHAILKQFSETDLTILRMKNLWDIRLFNLSRWIAQSDEHFYSQYGVDRTQFYNLHTKF